MAEAGEQTEAEELTEDERRQAKRERKGRAGPDAAGGADDDVRQAKRERKGRAGSDVASGAGEADPRQAKRERKGRAGPPDLAEATSGEDALSFEEGVARRLSRIEEAVASQAERSEELLERLDEILYEDEELESEAEEPAQG